MLHLDEVPDGYVITGYCGLEEPSHACIFDWLHAIEALFRKNRKTVDFCFEVVIPAVSFDTGATEVVRVIPWPPSGCVRAETALDAKLRVYILTGRLRVLSQCT